MKLSQLKISNFRGIKEGCLFFDDHNIILGQNNSGKSSVIDAIGLLLGRERLSRALGDYDFFGGSPSPEQRILITGILTGFVNDNPAQNPDWFNDIDGGVPAWFNLTTKRIDYGEKPEGSVLAVEIGYCARFDKEELEFETLRYFLNSESDPFEDTSIHILKGHKHLKELGFFLVPARRTWERTISFGSELFNKVVRFQDAIPGDTVVALRDTLRNVEERIEKQEPFKTIVERINSELQGFIGTENKSISFLPTSGDIEGVLNSITPFIQGNENTNIPVGKHGAGLISLQTLLLLLEFGRHRHETGKNFFLAVEEPELHLQPGLHKRLVSRIRGLSGQSISTTHSPSIASFYKPNEIIIVQNNNGILKAESLLKPGESVPPGNSVMKLFTLYRPEICEALMNDRILIPEGISDYYWLKHIMSCCSTAEGWEVYNTSAEKTKSFGIFPTQDAAVVETYKKFSHLANNLYPIVDGDAAGLGYIDSLKSCDKKPKIILELGQDKMIEDVISWIINPNAGIITEIEAFTESFNGETLSVFLRTKKSYWIYHERIVEYIIGKTESFKRAQKFINSIYCAGNLPDDLQSFWVRNQTKSDEHTTVLTFQYPV